MIFLKNLTVVSDSTDTQSSIVSPLATEIVLKSQVTHDYEFGEVIGAVTTLNLGDLPDPPPYSISNMSIATAERFSRVPRILISGENVETQTVVAFLGLESDGSGIFVTTEYNGDEVVSQSYVGRPVTRTQYISAVTYYDDDILNVSIYIGNYDPRNTTVEFNGSDMNLYPVPNTMNYEIIDSVPNSLSIRPSNRVQFSGKGSSNYRIIGATLNFTPFGSLDYFSITTSSAFTLTIPSEIGKHLIFGLYIKETASEDRYSIGYSFSDYGFSTNGKIVLYVGDDVPADPYSPGDTDPNAPGLGPGGVGGNGSFGENEVSDPITVPTGSVAANISSNGMFTRYLVTTTDLNILGQWLWATEFGLLIAKTYVSVVYGDPAESVISLMSYPFDLNSLDGVTKTNKVLHWGGQKAKFFGSAITLPVLTSMSGYVDWGTIYLEEYWKNFLDYEPHTKIELYLPWGTGFVSIDPGQCLPGSIRVITNIDLNKGSCVHNVYGNNECLIGSYSGQCSQQLPITANDYASKMAGVVVGATALAVGAVASGMGKSAAEDARLDYDKNIPLPPMNNQNALQRYYSGMEKAAEAASAPYNTVSRRAGNIAAGSSVAALRRTGNIARNGSFTDGSSSLGCQYPYIIVSRPTQSVPDEYGSHYGYPSNRTSTLRALHGYTEVGEIHLNGIPATEPELNELNNILKAGVIL